MLKNYPKLYPKSFFIALAYVAFATYAVLSMYPADMFYGKWIGFGLMVTFPVSMLSGIYRYTDPHSILPVLVIQAIMFLLTFIVLTKTLKK